MELSETVDVYGRAGETSKTLGGYDDSQDCCCIDRIEVFNYSWPPGTDIPMQ